MKSTTKLEVWLRGPIEDITPILQPVAHTLLQASEELGELKNKIPNQVLWERPAGVASIGFHLQHIQGILDRLFSYSKGESLSESQFQFLRNEGLAPFPEISYNQLYQKVNHQIFLSVDHLKTLNSHALTEVCYVGRAMIPSTQLGLLFHAAEHTQRHIGQLLVTYRILISQM